MVEALSCVTERDTVVNGRIGGLTVVCCRDSGGSWRELAPEGLLCVAFAVRLCGDMAVSGGYDEGEENSFETRLSRNCSSAELTPGMPIKSTGSAASQISSTPHVFDVSRRLGEELEGQ